VGFSVGQALAKKAAGRLALARALGWARGPVWWDSPLPRTGGAPGAHCAAMCRAARAQSSRSGGRWQQWQQEVVHRVGHDLGACDIRMNAVGLVQFRYRGNAFEQKGKEG